MRVISRKTLKDFWGRHADVEQPLKAWFHETKAARWSTQWPELTVLPWDTTPPAERAG